MANRCGINIYIPLDKVPDEIERQQLTALYTAKKKWEEKVKTNKKLDTWENRANFIASQPGIPFKKRHSTNSDLKQKSKQYKYSTIGADFYIENDRIWVFPITFGRNEVLMFDQKDGITVHKPAEETFISSYLPMQVEFRYQFPWWAQVGFAGAKKSCDEESQDPPKEQNQEFYDKWYEEHGDPITYLFWELPVSKILENLEYVIKTYENFPVNGLIWQWIWVWKALDVVAKIYLWFKEIHYFVPEAFARLDWGEVAFNMISFEEARADDDPNQIMSDIRKINKDTMKLANGSLSLNKFEKKYATHIKKGVKGRRNYTPIIERSLFDF